jgi:hypothetical protein
MGGGDDGIGRLVMRGKTCEVKAATPKGEGFGGKKFPSRGANGGGSHHQHYRQHLPPQYNGGHPEHQQLNHHIPSAYGYTDQMGYPMVPDVYSGAASGGYSSHYHHQGYHHLAGVNPYGAMSHLYYPSMNDGGVPAPAGAVYTGIHPSMTPLSTPPDVAPQFYMSSHDPTAAPVLVPDYYNHLSPTYTHQHASVAFVPMVPMPSAPVGGVTISHMPTSVMQPVAPGIPGKGTESHDSNE